MLPSETLRDIISKKNKLDLSAYAWQKGLKKKIFKKDFFDGSRLLSLEIVFKEGYNIGNCFLTAYHILDIIPNAQIYSGKVKWLKGTKNSANGDHVWIEDSTYIYDTTLMIVLPKKDPLSLYYTYKTELSPTDRSVFDVSYSHDIYLREHFPKSYYGEIYSISGKKRRKD